MVVMEAMVLKLRMFLLKINPMIAKPAQNLDLEDRNSLRIYVATSAQYFGLLSVIRDVCKIQVLELSNVQVLRLEVFLDGLAVDEMKLKLAVEWSKDALILWGEPQL